MTGTRAPVRDRVLRRVLVLVESGCWHWTGSLKTNGYGQINIGAGLSPASVHRVTYEEFVGPVPDGLELDHLCRNRACCNPDHLEPVTRADNVARGARAAGYADSRETCIRGHHWTPENTYRRFLGGPRWCRTCKRENREANA